ncbi:RNA polymerase sigma factor SigI [Nocardia sp. GAS34]|uniref:RNA polymerase sigma factor SigI n=1 Tax=unclassified Nocardia TaxID=2637762 RepID=UPI003D1E6969
MEMTRDLANPWRAHRHHLVGLALRMLGDVGAAEDVVQEAFTRLARTPDVEDDRAWLTTVTAHLCLDQLRSARMRRETPADPLDLTDRISLTHPPDTDPADRVTLDQEVQGAMFVVLQRLSPAERVAFILHDVFSLPFETIAETLGRPIGTCRQLARRARQKIAAAESSSKTVAQEQHHEVTRTFIEACAGGDIVALAAVLHEDAWGLATFLPGTGFDPVLSHGPQDIIANLTRYFDPEVTMVPHPAYGRPAILSSRDNRLFAVLVLTIDNGLIHRIDAVVDPTANSPR